MYAYGYRNSPQAWHTLADADMSDDPCKRCETCSVKCHAGFDVKEKITDIARLKNIPADFVQYG
jgi:hypothetical protein